MSRALMGSLSAAGLLWGAALTPSAATAAQVTGEEFTVELASASASSSALAKGTTVSSRSVIRVSPDTADTAATTNQWTVNPDGSLIVTQDSPSNGRERVRCVRVDRCWIVSKSSLGDSKWHRLPSGAVTYQQASSRWAKAIALPYPEAATFDISVQADGARVFTATVPEADGTVMTTHTVNEPNLTFEMRRVVAGGPPVTLMSVSITSRSDPIHVPPPARRLVGTPVPGSLDPTVALINS